MKNLVLASATLLAAASQASAAAIDTVNKSGFYVGIHGGYEMTKGKAKTNIVDTVPVPRTFTANHNASQHLKGAIGGFHLGYQHDLGRFVAGLEISSTFTKSHKKKLSEISFSDPQYISILDSKITHKNSYGAALRLGFKVAPCWVAGIKLGYARNKYNIKYSTSTRVAASGATLTGDYRKKNIRYNSFVPGIYVEKLLNRHWMIGTEYSCTLNKKKSMAQNYSNGGGVNTVTNFSYKPRTHDIKVRLGYKF